MDQERERERQRGCKGCSSSIASMPPSFAVDPPDELGEAVQEDGDCQGLDWLHGGLQRGRESHSVHDGVHDGQEVDLWGLRGK